MSTQKIKFQSPSCYVVQSETCSNIMAVSSDFAINQWEEGDEI